MGSLKKLAVLCALSGAFVGAMAFVVAGCYTTPAWKSGELKCSTDDMRACPSGAVCVNGYCYEEPDLSLAIIGIDAAAFVPTDLGTTD